MDDLRIKKRHEETEVTVGAGRDNHQPKAVMNVVYLDHDKACGIRLTAKEARRLGEWLIEYARQHEERSDDRD